MIDHTVAFEFLEFEAKSDKTNDYQSDFVFGKRFVRAPYRTFQRHISSINEKDDCVCDKGPFKCHSSPVLPAVL